jgi:hypothetical protein
MNLILIFKYIETMRRQMHRSSMRPRLVLRPRPIMRNKVRRNLIIAGSALVVNAALIFAYFYFGKTNNSSASTVLNGSTGNWNSTSTWTIGRVPASNDTVTIMSGNTVTITGTTSTYNNMKIIVYGTLDIQGGKKLLLCNGMIDVMAGGKIIGDNGGSMVDICAVMAWNGAMPGDGPMQIGATVLPVELAYFNAERAGSGAVNLSWQTASEVNCDYFAVERSENGSDFQILDKVQGAGNSTIARQYSYVDANPHTPVSYYRLKEIDFDGASETFKVVSVNIASEHELVIYPNPVSTGESATVQIPAGNEKTLQVSVMDIHGKKIFSQLLEKENSSDNMIKFVTDKFPVAGTYFITASGLSSTYLKKIVVL